MSGSSFEQTNHLHQKTRWAKFGWKRPCGSGEKDFSISLIMYCCYFVIISPWKKIRPFFWTNSSSYHQRMLCAKCAWVWLEGSWEDFQISSMYIHFRNYPSMGKGGALIRTNLNSLHKMMLCAKFAWNWLGGSWEKDF